MSLIAMIVIADEWSGVSCRESTLKDPTWSDVTRLIQGLDAKKRTMVVLKRDEDNSLMIGGGGGRYVLCATVGEGRFFNLVRPVKADAADICLNIGGQDSEYSAQEVVDEVTAIACATEYLKSGNMNSDFEWREQ